MGKYKKPSRIKWALRPRVIKKTAPAMTAEEKAFKNYELGLERAAKKLAETKPTKELKG